MPPRIPVMNPDDASPDVQEVFDRFMKARGNIPNLFRTIAVRPEIMLTLDAHLSAVLTKGTVEFILKEMCTVRTSANNKCAY